MFKEDKFITGFICGLLAPLLGFYIYFLALFRELGIDGFYHQLVSTNRLAAVISLSLLANLALFFIFDKYSRLRSQQGVIAATFLYGFYVVYLKVF
jgi:hypothetical protein